MAQPASHTDAPSGDDPGASLLWQRTNPRPECENDPTCNRICRIEAMQDARISREQALRLAAELIALWKRWDAKAICDPPPPRTPSKTLSHHLRVQILCERAERGEGLWHKDDTPHRILLELSRCGEEIEEDWQAQARGWDDEFYEPETDEYPGFGVACIPRQSRDQPCGTGGRDGA